MLLVVVLVHCRGALSRQQHDAWLRLQSRARTARDGAEIPAKWSSEAREAFASEGFVVREGVVSEARCEALRESLEALFAGEFDTGIFPDEWHWRAGLSKEHCVREMVNAWKSSDYVARIALDPEIAKLACDLMGWGGVRLAQDDVVWKPSGAGGVGFHRDSTYVSDNFEPRDHNSVTVWIALEPADAENGGVEYAVGSHKWPRDDDDFAAAGGAKTFFFGSEESRRRGACRPVGTGGAIFHHQDILHGSGPNTSTRPRRALVLHYIRDDLRLRAKADYIYGRYVLGDRAVHDAFFPLVYSRDPTAPTPTATRRLCSTCRPLKFQIS
ncbi:hypothetical protein CTAYLR_004316 [Chrysophaeum taylorii]|uniref:Phytanoyl-CoA dioxygenase n=1 Tax=Chrysophaeum taylorii TaxID=2483200 RepID=A0AAD7UI75_9STRA|nr:hypothetical protein CTAYLR_004316 [Chrysophaeum taylorii]